MLFSAVLCGCILHCDDNLIMAAILHCTFKLDQHSFGQVDVVFEEVDEIALQDAGLPFVAGRLAEPIQPQLLRMRSLLAASKCNVVLVDGLERVPSITHVLYHNLHSHKSPLYTSLPRTSLTICYLA